MARGWESKSVEEQQAQASLPREQPRKPQTPEQRTKERKQQGLKLARSRVLQQLENARNSQHREMLQNALADLDKQIAQLG